ncbi:hypothetical protein DASC09_021980 [Saccharomycopsis crataegensis]|uniref:Uncharacterized protein n=1 Tax=Saccharomycopsis crataegensis TaxID=43959 RepID=A0AAV5QL23_9ASCO|nr:hypothetical protein DASC09_021980 [Saccharomycopsis crataegensis]
MSLSKQLLSQRTRPSCYLFLLYITGAMTLPFVFTAYKTPFDQSSKGVYAHEHYWRIQRQ